MVKDVVGARRRPTVRPRIERRSHIKRPFPIVVFADQKIRAGVEDTTRTTRATIWFVTDMVLGAARSMKELMGDHLAMLTFDDKFQSRLAHGITLTAPHRTQRSIGPHVITHRWCQLAHCLGSLISFLLS